MAQFNVLVNLLNDTSNVLQRRSALMALGFARSPSLIERTLGIATSPYVIAQNQTAVVLAGLSKHKAGKEALWVWLKSNIDHLDNVVGNSLGLKARVVRICTSRFGIILPGDIQMSFHNRRKLAKHLISGSLSTRAQLDEVREFFKDRDTKVYL